MAKSFQRLERDKVSPTAMRRVLTSVWRDEESLCGSMQQPALAVLTWSLSSRSTASTHTSADVCVANTGEIKGEMETERMCASRHWSIERVPFTNRTKNRVMTCPTQYALYEHIHNRTRVVPTDYNTPSCSSFVEMALFGVTKFITLCPSPFSTTLHSSCETVNKRTSVWELQFEHKLADRPLLLSTRDRPPDRTSSPTAPLSSALDLQPQVEFELRRRT